MKKEKLHIVIVENLEYWLTNETSDWRIKEYIVRAPNRETAIKLTKEHLTVKEKTYIYSEDVWGHDMLIIDPSINKDKGVWKSVFLRERFRDKKGIYRYKNRRILVFASDNFEANTKFLRQYFQDNNIDWVQYIGCEYPHLQGVLEMNEK